MVELEGVAVLGRESETSPGDCADKSWSDFSVSGEDQKLGHRIASACLVAVREAVVLKGVGKSTPEGMDAKSSESAFFSPLFW